MNPLKLSRRAMLRGLGIGIALPTLDAMLDDRGLLHGTAHAQGVPLPRRLVTFYSPNGTNIADWTMASSGALTTAGLSPILRPLDPVKQYVNVLTGLDSNAAIASRAIGPGAHARGTGTFATGAPITETGAGGPSIDQVAAAALGGSTRYRSLAVADDHSTTVQLCNTSWDASGNPVPPKRTPTELFTYLFGGSSGTGTGGGAAAALAARRQSVLDYVTSDVNRLSARVGANDRARLDQHLTAIREIERELTFHGPACTSPAAPANDMASYAQTPARQQLMLRMIAIALQCDITRYVAFQIHNGGGGNPMGSFITGLHNPAMGHHSISHLTDANGRADQSTITRYEVSQYVYLLQQLIAMPEGGGNLLDNSLVLFGNEMNDGAGHIYRNLPLILAGRAGGVVTGRHLTYATGSSVGNLYLSMLQRVGVSITRFGLDGTMPLANLSG